MIIIKGQKIIAESYSHYLNDESKLNGISPENLYFPKTTEDLSQALIHVNQRNEDVTISGGRTGISGGAVNTHSKNIISLEYLNQKPQIYIDKQTQEVRVISSAGITLEALDTAISQNKYSSNYFYPVDPTEKSATIGGTVATNASGARTLFYGPTRSWITALKIVLPCGEILYIKKGENLAKDNILTIPSQKKNIKIKTPKIQIPNTKHVAGYYLKQNMDLIDLFIGSEGTLGIITEVEIKLEKKPENSIYLSILLSDITDLSKLVLKIKSVLTPIALEYIDPNGLKQLHLYREILGEASGIPQLPSETIAILYTEFHIKDHKIFYHKLNQILSQFNIPLESTWCGSAPKDLLAMKKMRHALPERINTVIADRKKKIPELVKVGTDMAVPDQHLKEILDFYNDTLQQTDLEYVIFGHIGNGHLHVNMLPKNREQLKLAKTLYQEFAQKVVQLNGSVAAEHGIGRLKKKYLSIQYRDQEIKMMQHIKQQIDPNGVLNMGVLF